MPTPLTVNGIVYQYPINRDVDWGQQATAWATAVTSGMLQKAGGAFALTAEVDFGAAFGLKAIYLKSRDAAPAAAGVLRLGNTESVSWRDAGDTQDVRIYVDADDELYYQKGAELPINLTTAAAGNVTGPANSTDNAVARFNGASGQFIQNSGVIIDDSDNVTVPGEVTFTAGAIELSKALPPIGHIMAFYDFNGDLTLDATYWVPCDGGMHTVGGVSRQTPDLSGIYICGFGTPGAGDINTAPWDTAVVGNTDHEIDISHTHDVNIASFNTSTDGAHTHTGGAHTHGNGTLFANIGNDLLSGTGRLEARFISEPGAFTVNQLIGSMSDDGAGSGDSDSAVEIGGSTASDGAVSTSSDGDHNHSVNPPNTTSTSALSATQSIQPMSVRVRYFMRAK